MTYMRFVIYLNVCDVGLKSGPVARGFRNCKKLLMCVPDPSFTICYWLRELIYEITRESSVHSMYNIFLVNKIKIHFTFKPFC